MDFYTLNPSSRTREKPIENFVSAIWTERYSSAGDINLVLAATKENIDLLPINTVIVSPTSTEGVLIETRSIENGLLTVTGNTVVKFANERVYRTSSKHEVQAAGFYTRPTNSQRPGDTMFRLFYDALVNTPTTDNKTGNLIGTGGSDNNMDNWFHANSLYVTDSHSPESIAPSFEQAYDAIKKIADAYDLGFKTPLLPIFNGFVDELKFTFTVYEGLNRTSSQTVRPVVRFSPNLDSLANVKDLQSVNNYKNVCYAYAPNYDPANTGGPGVAYADSGSAALRGFERRVLMINADDITVDSIGASVSEYRALIDQRAKDALANYNYTRLVDGEITAQSEFKYGTDYGLGDIIELQAPSGNSQKARVTEYIRTQDASGEKAYPTVSVVD